MFFCEEVSEQPIDDNDEGARSDITDLTGSKRPDDPVVAAHAAGRVVLPSRAPRIRRSARRRAHRARAPPDDAPADAYSIAQFCKRHAISQSFYFALQAAGLGPRTMKVGGRVLVSREAAAAWRRRRERAARRKG